jgi:hypothetical protein
MSKKDKDSSADNFLENIKDKAQEIFSKKEKDDDDDDDEDDEDDDDDD